MFKQILLDGLISKQFLTKQWERVVEKYLGWSDVVET